MHTVSVEEILDRSFDHLLGHLIYVVRDEALIFYVGQSKRDVLVRFWEHMHKPSRLGQLIALNKPDSLAWQVEFYTLADCRPFVQQLSLFSMQAWQHFDMDMAEKGMIAQMCPVLNKDFNPKPTRLPSRYVNGDLQAEDEELLWTAVDRPWLNKMSLAGWVYVQDEKNGRILWKHQDGTLLSDKSVVPYRQQGQLPPHHNR